GEFAGDSHVRAVSEKHFLTDGKRKIRSEFDALQGDPRSASGEFIK
ncbi:MAG: hypothetical protein RIR98_1519, partial [Bacteroidota bacterium]